MFPVAKLVAPQLEHASSCHTLFHDSHQAHYRSCSDDHDVTRTRYKTGNSFISIEMTGWDRQGDLYP